MVKRCAFLVASLGLVSSSVGCCCGLLHGYGYNRCNPCGPSYGAGYFGAPASPCGPGGCAPSYYQPGGASYYQGYGSSAFIGDPALSTASPVVPGAAFPATAAAPLNSLPTY